VNALQLYRLRDFCEANELDDALIDEAISYSENMDYLESLIVRDIADLVDEYAKTYAEMDRELPLADRYVIPEEVKASVSEVVYLKYKAVLVYWRERHQRSTKEVVHSYCDLCKRCPLQDTCTARVKVEVREHVIRFYGTIHALNEIQLRLRQNHVYHRVAKQKLYSRGLKLQFVSGHGWVHQPQP